VTVLDFDGSLSLGSVALVVAVVSALLAAVWTRLASGALTWILGLGAPLVIASSLYWLPVWLGASSSQYSTWAPLFIVPWYLAGATTSSLVIFFVIRHRARHIGHG
jgi:hypothetical protein